MNYFLLVYDRSAGTLLDLREYKAPDRATALMDRLHFEELYREDSGVEVVVLGAESKEDLANTHSRYFKSLAEHLQGLRDAS